MFFFFFFPGDRTGIFRLSVKIYISNGFHLSDSSNTSSSSCSGSQPSTAVMQENLLQTSKLLLQSSNQMKHSCFSAPVTQRRIVMRNMNPPLGVGPVPAPDLPPPHHPPLHRRRRQVTQDIYVDVVALADYGVYKS